jgi:hypothetical protein
LINIARLPPHACSSSFFLNFHDITYTIINHRNHVHQVRAQHYTVGSVDKYHIMVIMQTDWYWALTAPSIACMTSLT